VGVLAAGLSTATASAGGTSDLEDLASSVREDTRS
jgi:hypothetical protein